MQQPVPRLDDLIAEHNSRQTMLDRFGVYFLRDINDEEAERFGKSMLVMATGLKGYPGRRITVYINSGGGSVGAGFSMMESMYKVKREFGVSVDTVILGYAYSMGAIIAQAGDKRSMGFFSTMMLHGGTWTIVGEDRKIFSDSQKLATPSQTKTRRITSPCLIWSTTSIPSTTRANTWNAVSLVFMALRLSRLRSRPCGTPYTHT